MEVVILSVEEVVEVFREEEEEIVREVGCVNEVVVEGQSEHSTHVLVDLWKPSLYRMSKKAVDTHRSHLVKCLSCPPHPFRFHRSWWTWKHTPRGKDGRNFASSTAVEV